VQIRRGTTDHLLPRQHNAYNRNLKRENMRYKVVGGGGGREAIIDG